MILEQENIALKHAGSVSSHVTCRSLSTKIFENKSSCTPENIKGLNRYQTIEEQGQRQPL